MSNEKQNSKYKDLERRKQYLMEWRKTHSEKNRIYRMRHYYKNKETKTPKPKSEYNTFVAEHYHEFDHLPYKERVGAVSKLWLEQKGNNIMCH